MRFVLVGLSAAVALLVALNTSWSEVDEVPQIDSMHDSSGKRNSSTSSTCKADTETGTGELGMSFTQLLLTLRDMATGRYLYDFYQSQRLKAA